MDALIFKPLNATGAVDWDGSVPIVEGSKASDGTCVALLELSPSGACSQDPPDFSIRLDCRKKNLPNAGFVVDVGDVPKLPLGDHAVVATDIYPATAKLQILTLHVESKAGLVGEYTDVRTADFDEKFSLDFRSSVFTAWLDFEITASELRQGSKTCQVCAC